MSGHRGSNLRKSWRLRAIDVQDWLEDSESGFCAERIQCLTMTMIQTNPNPRAKSANEQTTPSKTWLHIIAVVLVSAILETTSPPAWNQSLNLQRLRYIKQQLLQRCLSLSRSLPGVVLPLLQLLRTIDASGTDPSVLVPFKLGRFSYEEALAKACSSICR